MLVRYNGYFAEYVWVPENRVYTLAVTPEENISVSI
jgi:threonine dehydrogenase-like Zn-dependent dehydrogenase